jgi:hypothetical protein
MLTKIFSKNDLFLLWSHEFENAVISFFGKDNPVKIEEFEKECGAVFNVELDYHPITQKNNVNCEFFPKLAIVTDIKKWVKAAKKYNFTESHLPEHRYYPASYNGHKDFLKVFKSLPKRNNQKIKEVHRLFETIEEAWTERNPRIHFIYLNKYEECSSFVKTKKHVIMSESEIKRRMNINSNSISDIITSKTIKLSNKWGLSYMEKVYVGKHKVGFKFKIVSKEKLMLCMLSQ